MLPLVFGVVVGDKGHPPTNAAVIASWLFELTVDGVRRRAVVDVIPFIDDGVVGAAGVWGRAVDC
jgi:hypothetical protein